MSNEQRVVELLKPRYKVIADYPGSKFSIDAILMQFIPNSKVWRHRWADGEWSDTTVRHPGCYPHLFRKLDWWEEREPGFIEDIKYLAWVRKTQPRYPFPVISINTERRIAVWNQQGYGPPLSECEPTTEAEYLTYQNQSK